MTVACHKVSGTGRSIHVRHRVLAYILLEEVASRPNTETIASQETNQNDHVDHSIV